MTQYTLTVAWFAETSPSPWCDHERLSGLTIEWFASVAKPKVWAQLHVIECHDADQLERSAQFRHGMPGAILYVVPHFLVSAAAALLREEDDVCLLDAHPNLMHFRLERLLEGASALKQRRHQRENRDSLTQLQNRKFFFGQLERTLAKALPQQQHTLLYADIDHFKRLNDNYGHLVGDEILRELAERLTLACPTMSLLARAGGEEFWVLLPVGPGEGLVLAERLLRMCCDAPFCPIDAGVDQVKVTISIGVASTVGQRCSAEELVRAAEDCLYAAKVRGRNCAVHKDQLEQEALDKGTRPELETFENITKVLTERIGEVIAWRGRRLFEQVREQADLDSLTGLYSRRYFDRRLPFEFEQSVQASIPFTLALLDVDFFGEVNKEYGWPTGDLVLSDVAARIQSNVRADDWVARYGGEEICIVMRYCTAAQAESALERIRLAIAEAPFTTTDGKAVQVTASIGAAMRQPGEMNVAALMERTSERLLEAKRNGRNQLACSPTFRL